MASEETVLKTYIKCLFEAACRKGDVNTAQPEFLDGVGGGGVN